MIGQRIRLDYTSDPYTNLRPGDLGTVTFIDALGTIAVRWDSGSTLGLVPGEDRFTLLQPEVHERSGLATKAHQRDFAETHAEGLHTGCSREFCPECEAEDLDSQEPENVNP